MSRVRYAGGRSMLNRRGFQSTAAIVAEIEDTSTRSSNEEVYGGSPRYTLQFANCDRSIGFDLDWYTADGRANNLYKLNTMIRLLTEFRDHMVIENKRMTARERRLAKEN